MATVTNSRRRSERASGSKKVAASTPKPRQTSVGNRGAQAGPLKPGTRTSGTPQVNSSSPAMRQIQAKASAARAQAQGQPGIKGPISLPNSRRAGVNLPKTGSQVVKPPAGQMSPARTAALKAQGAAAKAAAQTKRANAAANTARRNAVNTKLATKNLQGLKAAASALGGARGLAFQAIGEAIAPRPTASYDTLKGAMKKGLYKPQQGPAVPKRLTQAGMDKGSFDKAFKASREAGKKVFTWRGNKYNTKLKGEK